VKPVRLERHRLGPRVFVLGVRVHEWHLGLALAFAYAAAVRLGVLHVRYSAALVLPAAGLWLVAKDWRDLFESQRDTASWQLGLHRPAPPLRPVRRFDSLPAVTAMLALLAAVANGSAAVFDGAWRGDLLFQLRPLSSIPVFQTFAVPAAAALVLTALYLRRRRRAAWALAVATFLAAAVVEVARRSFGDAAASFAAAGVLFWGRSAFPVRTDAGRLRAVVWRLPAVFGTWLVGAFAVLWVAAPTDTGPGLVAENTGRLLLWQTGTIGYYDEARAIPPVVRATSLLLLLVAAYVVFRRPAPERLLPGPELRRAAASLVRAHGDDTLAFFKLREDTHYLFDATRRAFFAYRVEAGTMLISGDPVGPEEALPGLIRDGCALADRYGLKLGVVGASSRTLPLFADAGLRALYVGDEAIVDTAGFSLDGRSIRKVRQSVHRLEKAGFSIVLESSGSIGDAARLELERLADDAARPLEPERADRVHDRARDPAPARARRRRGVPELRRLRALDARSLQPRGALAGAARGGREPVLPDREPLSVQREVRAEVGAALPPLRAGPRPAADGARHAVGRGTAREAARAPAQAAAPRARGGLAGTLLRPGKL
jgi:lysylphosphatidylglycerol synthetase-like protein (DUF2156 family)